MFHNLLPHALISFAQQNLSCFRGGVGYSRFIGNNTAEELLTPLLRQFNFWCESGITLTTVN